jgi:hypothetical protein
MNIDRVETVLKQIRADIDKSIMCGDKNERYNVYSALLPQALVIAELLLADIKESEANKSENKSD